jgi:hypothetical protein
MKLNKKISSLVVFMLLGSYCNGANVETAVIVHEPALIAPVKVVQEYSIGGLKNYVRVGVQKFDESGPLTEFMIEVGDRRFNVPASILGKVVNANMSSLSLFTIREASDKDWEANFLIYYRPDGSDLNKWPGDSFFEVYFNKHGLSSMLVSNSVTNSDDFFCPDATLGCNPVATKMAQ